MADFNPQILFYGKVKDSQDPLKIGRVRVFPQSTDISNVYKIPKEILDDSGTDVKEKYWWKREDPFVYLPLLPYFLNIQPKENEFVHILYSNKEFPLQNKFYISGVLSTPTAIKFQNYFDSTTFLSDGTNNKVQKEIITELGTGDTKTDSYGIFPLPEDNAILGRGSTDLILKENTVLLRAGKSEIENNRIPIANNNRAFLELDYFPSNKSKGASEKKITQSINVALVKYLVEYQIYNPENKQNMFMGVISIFNLKPNILTNTNNLNQESNIDSYKPPALYQINFVQKTMEDVIELINEFVNGVNESFINIENYPTLPLVAQFPFYYRMSKINYNQMTSESSPQEVKDNLNLIFKGVNPFQTSSSKGNTGYGLVSAKNVLGNTFNYKIEEYTLTDFSERPKTYGILGGDELYLISHDSEIPGKQKIKIDKSLYGYTQDQIALFIKENTEGVVRGEQLISFLNLIVNFLLNHVHPIPNTPPNPVAIDGTQKADILKTINEAPIKMLNDNIRIN